MPHRPYWNVVDTSKPHHLLMNVSTTQAIIASTEADAWRRNYPTRTFALVKTDVLEPYKVREVGNESE